jgi:hypothetical protein
MSGDDDLAAPRDELVTLNERTRMRGRPPQAPTDWSR